ncbi:anti-sigma factor [Nocardia blacklockiae]|uniref:anti-sigma factor n=1 Tax=Nocardia blacklockiae TaxID=480036 RepID=UPI0018945CAD|nr:anti-sigma factor [Nocardia blacklockiae]MBF6171868.1 anti-sigma factor [Nocardia blacklockiae]
MDLGDSTSRPPAHPRGIDVRVRADFEELPMLRAVAETVALFAEFGIDKVVDLRLAVEEVATALVQDAVDGSDLDCSFGYGDGSLSVRMSVVTVTDSGPDPTSLGWHIVSTLTDGLETTVGPFEPARSGHHTTVEFSWTAAAVDER